MYKRQKVAVACYTITEYAARPKYEALVMGGVVIDPAFQAHRPFSRLFRGMCLTVVQIAQPDKSRPKTARPMSVLIRQPFSAARYMRESINALF